MLDVPTLLVDFLDEAFLVLDDEECDSLPEDVFERDDVFKPDDVLWADDVRVLLDDTAPDDALLDDALPDDVLFDDASPERPAPPPARPDNFVILSQPGGIS